MTWRQHPDPNEEAKRLGVLEITQRLGWSKAKLTKELSRVASDEAFLERIRRAVEALDPPRLLDKTGSGYVTYGGAGMGGSDHTQPGNLRDEPEAIRKDCGRRKSGGGECCQIHIAQAARDEVKARKRERLEEARSALKKLRSAPSCSLDLGTLERRLDATERKLA